MTAPNPNGCYVKVFDQPQFRGAADFLNGPMRYSTLVRLANGANWANRIRSLEVGPGATATAWAEVNYAGTSMELRVDTRYPTLPSALVGTIKALDVRCIQAAGSTP
jgi:beta/gamma crystallin